MANENTEITYELLKEHSGIEDEYLYATIQFNDLYVKVKRRLSLYEMIEFVDSVVKICFPDNDAKYMPEVKDLAIRRSIVEMYTGIEFPVGVEEVYDFVYGTNIVQSILEEIDAQQFQNILDSIDEKLDYITQTNIEDITNKVNELYTTLESLANQFTAALPEFDKEAIADLMKWALNGPDEKKIVDAIFEARDERAKEGE